VRGLIAESAGGAWSFGGSILTFAFPMILFIVVAVGLYVLYTKPEVVPGHRAAASERPVSYTAIPGKPEAAGGANPGNALAAGPAAGDGGDTPPDAASTDALPGKQEPEVGE
jgi:hypothetical protein